MCIVREKSLSADDLAFLTGSSANNQADEDTSQRSMGIHERTDSIEFGPVPLSQIVRSSFGSSAQYH